MFTKRHYKAIAAVVSALRHGEGHAYPGNLCSECLVKEFVDLFEADNPRFDVGAFEDACQRQIVEEKAG